MKVKTKRFLFLIRTNAKVRTFAFVCVFYAGAAAGLLIGWKMTQRYYGDALFGFQKIHPLNDHFKFINPLLGFDSAERTHSEYTQLKNRIQLLIDSSQVAPHVDRISVYFRNLETGEWVGINPNEDFDPASLLKVPVMMYYLKLAESDRAILSRTYSYTASDISLLKISQGDIETRLVQGRPYTVDQLIYEMIVRSDNVAKYLLILNSPASDLDNMYGDLGIQIHKGEGNKYTISARTYSLFFRNLYNSTFLTRAMSEHALGMLNEAEFKDGLVAGVPSDTKVAHKFGRYTILENSKVAGVETHDCGIVYYPEAPYLLCVMTRGNDTAVLENIISQVSQITYEFMVTK